MSIRVRTLRRRGVSLLAGLLLCLLVVACSSVPSAERHIPPTTQTRHAAAVSAIRQLGDRYQPNRAGPKAFDAAGLVYYAYRQAGAGLPRGLQGQLDAGKPITLAQAQPADLAFFQVDGSNGHPHKTVGLLTSKDQMVIAMPGQGDQGGVRLVNVGDNYWSQRLVGVIQVLPKEQPHK